MAKGRTKNKRARKPEDGPERIFQPLPPAPTAYFSLPSGLHGFAEAALNGRFYQPLEPVYDFRVTVLPHAPKALNWSRNGWKTELSQELLPFITPSVERSFSPLRFRFKISI